jgi:xanthine dehydrogenase accessory factor
LTMELRGIRDVLDAEAEVRRRGEGAVIVSVVGSAVPSIRPGVRLVVREDGRVAGAMPPAVASRLSSDALERLRSNRPGMGSYLYEDGELRPSRVGQGDFHVFFEVLARPPELIVAGAGHIAVPLARLGSLLDFQVTVLDDRAEYASPERFPDAHRLLVGPYAQSLSSLDIHAGSYIVLVTRGHVHDQACLDMVIDGPAAYIGMIGSKRRVRTVLEGMRARHGAIERHVYAPIGLDIGARTPAEIAVAIMAEIIGVRRGHEGAASLSRGRERA